MEDRYLIMVLIFAKKSIMCGERCPECEAICTKVFGHEGKHKPQIHRNKDIQQFTALEVEYNQNLIIQNDEGLREFELGESCEPENCVGSCSRRSRAHYHLVKCKGGQMCAQVLLNKGGKKVANHQSQQYKFTNGIFDEILCENYWDFIGWEHPVDNASRKQISLCNYYCSACGEFDKQYCDMEAWHTNSSRFVDHSFNCKQSHKNEIGVDIQFVIDTTSSMQEYIKMVKRTVKILMTQSQPYFKTNKQGILFSIISYKDHCDKQLLESINFTSHDEAIKFIKTLKAHGGGDQPEAMLDGLDEGVKKSWRDKTKKFMFLITDAPPHGNPKFHNIEELYPNGCPCGLTEDKVLPQIKKKGIELIVYKLNDSLNQTLEIFKKIMPKLQVLQKITNDEFVQKISQLVCRELVIREITIRKN